MKTVYHHNVLKTDLLGTAIVFTFWNYILPSPHLYFLWWYYLHLCLYSFFPSSNIHPCLTFKSQSSHPYPLSPIFVSFLPPSPYYSCIPPCSGYACIVNSLVASSYLFFYQSVSHFHHSISPSPTCSFSLFCSSISHLRSQSFLLGFMFIVTLSLSFSLCVCVFQMVWLTV